MIDPYFYRCPPELGLNFDAPGYKFKIIGYSTFAHFTLVRWKFENETRSLVGECLYKDRTMVLWSGGTLDLGEKNIADMRVDPQKRLPSVDAGITQSVAKKLRSRFIYVT